MDFNEHTRRMREMEKDHERMSALVMVFFAISLLATVGILALVVLVVTHFVWGWP